jgi:hypothetical protein
MPRIDDYIAACRLARDKLAVEPYKSLLARSGFEPAEGGALRIPFLNRVYRLSYPDLEFADAGAEAKEVPLQEQVLILHYLQADPPVMVSGEWVAYREIPGATFYFGAFVKRAVDPLKKAFGQTANSEYESLEVIAQQNYLYLEAVERPVEVFPGLVAFLSGAWRLDGPVDDLELSGDLTVESASLRRKEDVPTILVDWFGSPSAAPTGGGLALDVHAEEVRVARSGASSHRLAGGHGRGHRRGAVELDLAAGDRRSQR